ncbi:hypothetical protein [Sulfobacillus harzensis]|uniref:Uncharacterized protein n=1 Tax=Sulfobacillus harzensis TaxID=2729629 RepID=A0A7Y0Q0E6_9FIRM|nr:hypothetical protein [Sulfobacillus harzensis]NMP20943.1 hypothetical protein [Sulfobacillus harzensis]
MAWLTVIASILIAGPMALWMTGVGPSMMLVISFTGLVLTARLYAVAAGIAESSQSAATLGLFSGLIGSLVGELLLHLSSRSALTTAFAAYASLGAELYRLDVLSRWWPFLFVALNGLFYAGLALLIRHLVDYRQSLLGIEPPHLR